MSEFVEEGLDVVVFHECGVARCRLREVAYQRGGGQLQSLDAAVHAKARGVSVLAFSRVHVEVELCDEGVPFIHVIGFDRRMPHTPARLLKCDAINLACHAKNAAFDLFVGEVLADFLGVVVEFLLFEGLDIIESVPWIEAVGVGDVGFFERHEFFDFGLGSRFCDRGDVLDEV